MKLRFAALSLFLLTTCAAIAQERQTLPGTKVSMLPPTGFALATTFSGYQQAGTNSSIMVVVIPGPYAQVSAGLTVEALKATGVIITHRHDTTFNNGTALILRGTQNAYGQAFNKEMLLFGDAGKTIMLNAAFPQANKELAKPIHAAMLRVQYDEAKVADPGAAVGFSVDPTGTNYITTNGLSGAISLKPRNAPDKPDNYFIAASSIGKALISDEKTFAVDRLKKLPGHANDVILENNQIEINGLKGYEVLAESTTNSQKKQSYLVALFTPERSYYLMVGSTDTDYQNNIAQFKKLARTFKRK